MNFSQKTVQDRGGERGFVLTLVWGHLTVDPYGVSVFTAGISSVSPTFLVHTNSEVAADSEFRF